MSPPRLGRAEIDSFLDAACRTLRGEFLLIGGAAAAVWFEAARVTSDIDLIGLSGTQDERFQLMNLSHSLGLPIETVNSAADYFVRQIPDWREHLEVLTRGEQATIYRPDVTLFLLLKIGRLSEADLSDCLGLVATSREQRLVVDHARLKDALAKLPASVDDALLARRAALSSALDELSPVLSRPSK